MRTPPHDNGDDAREPRLAWEVLIPLGLVVVVVLYVLYQMFVAQMGQLFSRPKVEPPTASSGQGEEVKPQDFSHYGPSEESAPSAQTATQMPQTAPSPTPQGTPAQRPAEPPPPAKPQRSQSRPADEARPQQTAQVPGPPGPQGPAGPPGPSGQGGGQPTRTRLQPVAVQQSSPNPTDWWWFKPRQQRDLSVSQTPAEEKKPEGEGGKQQGKPGSQLFPQAVWEVPHDKYKVLYNHQLIHGVLAQNINNTFPGMFVVLTDEPVMDQWGHGHELLPRSTWFVGQIKGESTFGQEAILATVYQANFPDGRSVAWKDGQIGSDGGSNGIPAEVNNHYAKLLMGVGISAVLTMGPRIVAGSPNANQYQPTVPQELAQQAAQGASQQLAQVIQKQFILKPTLTADFGQPITLQFLSNISFQTNPVIVSK